MGREQGWIHVWSCNSGSVMVRVQEKSERIEFTITWLLIISGGFETLSVSELWRNMNVLIGTQVQMSETCRQLLVCIVYRHGVRRRIETRISELKSIDWRSDLTRLLYIVGALGGRMWERLQSYCLHRSQLI